MAKVTLRNGKQVGDYLTPYFIAELNTSHFGDLNLSRSMIQSAHDAGANCVKFQSWSAGSLYSDAFYRVNPIAKRLVDKFSLDATAMKAMAAFCSELGIDFASTPYSLEEAQFLVDECQVPFIKIASMELNHHAYLNALAQLGVPLVLSTGMGTTDEITAAVKVIHSAGMHNLIVLHCVSVYPVADDAICLRNIEGLRGALPGVPVGYSDHSLGSEAAFGATALGACLIEKHFTLDATRIGMDNQMAASPETLRSLVQGCLRVHRSLGSQERVLSAAEESQRVKMRRSLVVRCDLPAGHRLSACDVQALRPGTGLEPNQLHEVLGRQLIQPLRKGDAIEHAHLESLN